MVGGNDRVGVWVRKGMVIYIEIFGVDFVMLGEVEVLFCY